MTPEAINSILDFVVPVMLVAAVAWLILWVFQNQRRKALNLTTSETVSEKGIEPGFLTIDHEKREAALRGGEAFDAEVAARDAPPETIQVVEKCRGGAKVIAVLLALVTLVTGLIGALMRIEAYDQAARRLGAWDNILGTVTQYPLGFAISAGIIGVTAFNAFRTVQRA